MSESKSILESKLSKEAQEIKAKQEVESTLNDVVTEIEFTSLGLKLPETLRHLSGDFQKFINGDNELIILERKNIKPLIPPKTESEAAETEAAESEEAGNENAENEEAEIEETGSVEKKLHYIVLGKTIEKRNNKPINTEPTLIAYFLYNSELAEEYTETHIFPKNYPMLKELYSQNIVSCFYMDSDLSLFQSIFDKGFYFQHGFCDQFSLGLMTESIAEEFFTHLAEKCLTSNEIEFLKQITPYKEIDPEEILAREKIQKALQEKRYDEAVVYAKAFHENLYKVNKSKGINSVNQPYLNLKYTMDDSRLAYELAENLFAHSFKDTAACLEIYRPGAYYGGQAKKLLLSLVISETANTDLKEDQEIRRLRSKGIHLAFQSWSTGLLHFDELEIMIKLLNFQAGCEWSNPKDRLIDLDLQKYFSSLNPDTFSEFLDILYLKLSDALYQYYEIKPKEETPQSILKEEDNLKLLFEKSIKPFANQQIVEWFSKDLEAPFPIQEASVQEKCKKPLPSTLKLLNGNLDHFLSDYESPEIVFFERSSEEVKAGAEIKEAEESEKVTFILLKREKASKTSPNSDTDQKPISLFLFFNTTKRPPSGETTELIGYDQEIYSKMDEVMEGSKFYSWKKPLIYNAETFEFQGGNVVGYQIDPMLHDYAIEFFQTLTDLNFLSKEESQYMHFILQGAYSNSEKLAYKQIKRALSNKQYDKAVVLAEEYHTNLKQENHRLGHFFKLHEPGFASYPFDPSAVALCLGEYLIPHSTNLAIKAFEIISEDGAIFQSEATDKIGEIAIKAIFRDKDPRNNRILRELGMKNINVLDLPDENDSPDEIQKMRDRSNLNIKLFQFLIRIHCGLSENFLPEDYEVDFNKTAFEIVEDEFLTLVEKMADKLYEYRKLYGSEPLLRTRPALSFGYTKSSEKGLDDFDLFAEDQEFEIAESKCSSKP